jgi:hypothetical protein
MSDTSGAGVDMPARWKTYHPPCLVCQGLTTFLKWAGGNSRATAGPLTLGTYNPDWAIVREEPDGQHKVFLVRETKGTTDWLKIPEIQRKKIQCGKAHFKDCLANAAPWGHSFAPVVVVHGRGSPACPPRTRLRSCAGLIPRAFC